MTWKRRLTASNDQTSLRASDNTYVSLLSKAADKKRQAGIWKPVGLRSGFGAGRGAYAA